MVRDPFLVQAEGTGSAAVLKAPALELVGECCWSEIFFLYKVKEQGLLPS